MKRQKKDESAAMNRRQFLGYTALMGGMLAMPAMPAWAQAKKSLSVATGGTGGVYYPYGGAIAQVISKHMPGVDATAEVTAASVDNCKLVGANRADLAFCMADTAYDALQGLGKFKAKLPLTTVAVLYPNYMHVVAQAGKIKSVADLKGKKVSTGAPGSGTEVMALRVLEAAGINPDKDISRDRLGVAESAGALKDNKIDALFWAGGLPTAAILDLAATPGMSISLLPHADLVPKMVAASGPVYYTRTIAKTAYMNQEADVEVSAVANILLCNEKADTDMIYKVIKAMFDHHSELVAVHKEAEALTLKDAVAGSPLPFHAGAVKFFAEKGVKI